MVGEISLEQFVHKTIQKFKGELNRQEESGDLSVKWKDERRLDRSNTPRRMFMDYYSFLFYALGNNFISSRKKNKKGKKIGKKNKKV